MIKYIANRILESLIILFMIITFVFLLLRMMPMEGYIGEGVEKLSEEQKYDIYRSMGLLDPIPVQLGNFYSDLIRGDFGDSITYRPKVSVKEIIAPKIKYSFSFGIVAFILSYIIGIPLGIIMAMHKDKLVDRIGNGYVVIIKAVPAAVYFLFIQIYVTSILSIPMLFQEDNPSSWILPVLCMSLGGIAGNAMWMRRFMVDELNKDYIKLAKAKGMSIKKIMFSHVMRNAFVPMSHSIPTGLLMQIAGSIYIEHLYSVPGMGGLIVTAIQRQDNSLVQILVLVFSSIGVIGLFLGDIMMAFVDPRIKLVRGGNR